jgi:hypothetical protein
MPSAAALAIGVVLGWSLANVRPPVIRAQGADRWLDSILLSGPTMVRYDDGLRAQLSHDAIYYLDYKEGRLVATVPILRNSADAGKVIEGFSERDLVADFKLDLEKGPKPHFVMTTGALGTRSDGSAPLYVVETQSNQLAVYRVTQQMYGVGAGPQFELLEVRTLPAPASR